MQGSITYSQWARYLSLNLLVCWKIGKNFLPGCKLLLPRLSLEWLVCLLHLLPSFFMSLAEIGVYWGFLT